MIFLTCCLNQHGCKARDIKIGRVYKAPNIYLASVFDSQQESLDQGYCEIVNLSLQQQSMAWAVARCTQQA